MHKGISIPIPRNYQKIEASDLAQLVSKKDPSLALIDVRDLDFTGGHIPGAVHIPYGEIDAKAAEVAKTHGDKKHVVFYCQYGQLRSPNAALSFIKHLPKDSGKESNVFVLSGGFHDYLKKYHKDHALVEGFDQACYSPEFLHVNDTNQSSVRLRPDLQKH